MSSNTLKKPAPLFKEEESNYPQLQHDLDLVDAVRNKIGGYDLERDRQPEVPPPVEAVTKKLKSSQKTAKVKNLPVMMPGVQE